MLKRSAYSDWYRDNIIQDSGIWVGNGITEQMLFNVNYKELKDSNNCNSTFGFYLKNGSVNFIKLIGMKESSE